MQSGMHAQGPDTAVCDLLPEDVMCLVEASLFCWELITFRGS